MGGMWEGGKGSDARPCDVRRYRANFDGIRWQKKRKAKAKGGKR
jgi:hypothetical protein